MLRTTDGGSTKCLGDAWDQFIDELDHIYRFVKIRYEDDSLDSLSSGVGFRWDIIYLPFNLRLGYHPKIIYFLILIAVILFSTLFL